MNQEVMSIFEKRCVRAYVFREMWPTEELVAKYTAPKKRAKIQCKIYTKSLQLQSGTF